MKSGREAIKEVFIVNRRSLLTVAERIVGSAGLAEDVVQDAYLKCWDACAMPVRCHISYATQVVRNLALDYYRRQQVEKRLFAPEQDGAEIAGRVDMPERQAIAHEALSALLLALAQLPARTCEAFAGYYFRQQTQAEIARHLGVSTTLVNFMLRDAREALAANQAFFPLISWHAELHARLPSSPR